MITYLLPLLIGYTGGSMVHGQRGAVVGAIATMGVIVGADLPMFIGAMIMGPLGGWVIKKFDDMFADNIRAGFEMLVNNFSAGLLGFALAVLGFYVIGPADVVTTAIGPNILPFIAELIAKGIQKRRETNVEQPLDVIACENMIGGSQFLLSKVQEFLTEEDTTYVDKYVGFPNAAVDRIVPIQHHDDPLFVSVEPFSEWLVDETQCKNTELRLEGVGYVADLEPYIERKLFSVNTGHATTAYTGSFYGYQTIGEAIQDERVLNQLKEVLQETGALLIAKWDFDAEAHDKYINKIIDRFANPHISDDISRVARTPMRKLGFDERFIRPIREAKERNLSYKHLLEVVAMILQYNDPEDSESVELQKRLAEESLETVVKSVTSLEDEEILAEIQDLLA